MATEALLELKQLVVRRGERCMGPLSLSLHAGDGIAIVGANGSGKSSLLEAVAGFLPVESGNVLISGVEMERAAESIDLQPPISESVAPWQRGIGWLGQQRGLWPHMTLRQQSGLHPEAFSGTELLECARDLNLESLLDRKPDQLSGGEAQRGELLRAIGCGSPLLILDEPFSAQNAAHKQGILARLKAEKSRGKAILMALHEPLEGVESIPLHSEESV